MGNARQWKELNAKNQRVQTSFGDGSYWDYSYDDKGQITGAVKRDADGTALAGMQYGYVYDGIGNRESAEEGSSANAVSYSSNQLNQYTAINTALPTYDADGNLLTTGNGWSYTYNGENRLIQAENSDTKLVLSYDYMGRRFEKKVYTKGILSLYSWSLSKHYRYIYDDYKLVEIRDANDGNALLKSFVWQPADAGQDVPLSMSYDGSTYYYIVDGNKNVTGLQDESGNRVATYTYGPFGQLLSMDGGLAEENPLRFSSEYFDDETGLVYYNYRYYSPRMGRWINRDPIEEEGGVNLYVVAQNNTINHYDNRGLNSSLEIPFYVGGSKLRGNDSSDKIGNAIGAYHVDIFEKISGGYSLMLIGAGGSEDRRAIVDYTGYKFYKLSHRQNGSIRWGNAKGTKCKCVNVDDIRSCLLSAPRPINTSSNIMGANCQTDVEYVITGCCLSGYSALNGLLTPENYKGDEEKVMQCFNDKVGKWPYIFMHPSDILKMCQRNVMRGNYD